jgi:hypothetical protein
LPPPLSTAAELGAAAPGCDPSAGPVEAAPLTSGTGLLAHGTERSIGGSLLP